MISQGKITYDIIVMNMNHLGHSLTLGVSIIAQHIEYANIYVIFFNMTCCTSILEETYHFATVWDAFFLKMILVSYGIYTFD